MANSAAVLEPLNPTFKIARAPTLPLDEAIPIKHDFCDTFLGPDFTGSTISFEETQRGNLKKDSNGNPIPIKTQRNKGHVKDSFKRKHNLSSSAKPWAFAESFLPYLQNKKDPKQSFSFDLLKQWTNLKADLAGAGEKVYKNE